MYQWYVSVHIYIYIYIYIFGKTSKNDFLSYMNIIVIYLWNYHFLTSTFYFLLNVDY